MAWWSFEVEDVICRICRDTHVTVTPKRSELSPQLATLAQTAADPGKAGTTTGRLTPKIVIGLARAQLKRTPLPHKQRKTVEREHLTSLHSHLSPPSSSPSPITSTPPPKPHQPTTLHQNGRLHRAPERHRQVVQRREGIRLHHPRERLRRPLRPLPRH
jgi:hypothetical protein